jgi:hypothetical protein
MDLTAIDELSTDKLARLLEPENLAVWNEEDLEVILHLQLSAPVLPDLLTMPGAELTRLTVLMEGYSLQCTFLEYLTSENPKAELLEEIKRFARHIREDRASPAYGAPALVLYYAAIASTFVNCHIRNTLLSNRELTEGFAWAVDQPVAVELRTLFTEACVILDRNL